MTSLVTNPLQPNLSVIRFLIGNASINASLVTLKKCKNVKLSNWKLPGGLHQENLCPRSRMYGPRSQAEVSEFKTEGKVFLDKDRPRPVGNLFISPLNFL